MQVFIFKKCQKNENLAKISIFALSAKKIPSKSLGGWSAN
ncbi:hypothetical protein AO385_0926 [Moraxella catarrhalis]|uniref:Uncharacterized protein n=1 Tax=Moraxella catarrhalis TaxID=480 RepID=A0A198UFT8_MORCA|nr:hypothetical protein AO384_1484 [Moraxella catarrhalis]OAU98324.1 hypothetical protein AO383_0780 [Moraxella catarrhalis]OAV01824.1 hypothetical protein AO382_0190 [Moraxella catarrhalis]OAV02598.1 hypothetical protein AO385_0926 [Moraxella catarrhalis]